VDERIKEAFQDPVKFCRVILGFEPTEYQLDLIDKFKNEQFVAARWCRQSGKSHIIAAMLLWYALTHPTSHIAIVGPSWRQTKIIIRRINTFLRRLPKQFYDRVLRTMVRLNNGSLIEAFPNNPETIRGPTLHVVYCDEMNFIANDEELYDAILFTLGTTNGKFVCTSTPWSTDSIFYRIWHDKAFRDFATSHITYKQALEEKGGPLKKQIVDKIRKQFEGDPWRWQREMMAEWAEDESVWLPQALISSCIDHQLELYEFDDLAKGEFYAGLDLGKYQDYSVLEVVQLKDEIVSLVHEHRFPLKTPYASVIGYVKTLSDRWGFRKVLVDMSGVGDYIVEDMVNAGIRETDGVKFTQPAKEELATYMKQLMVQGKFKLSYNSDLIAELNVERFELAKTGAIKFSHPEGTHDDRFWALALAVMATRKGESPSRLVRAY
jgi:phage FluMu gp28-like protein